MSRQNTALLYRLRMGSAHTRDQLYHMGKCEDQYFTHCGEVETLEGGILMGYYKYAPHVQKCSHKFGVARRPSTLY